MAVDVRRLVYDMLVATIGEFTGNRIYQRGSTGHGSVPAVPDKPFAIYGEGVTAPFPEVAETSDAEVIPYEVYLYVERGSHTEITEVLRSLRVPVAALYGDVSPSGARCLGTTWGGISQDFIDTEFDANVRFASFTVTGTHHKES